MLGTGSSVAGGVFGGRSDLHLFKRNGVVSKGCKGSKSVAKEVKDGGIFRFESAARR